MVALREYVVCQFHNRTFPVVLANPTLLIFIVPVLMFPINKIKESAGTVPALGSDIARLAREHAHNSPKTA